MMPSLLQIFATIFAVFALSRVVTRWRARHLSNSEAFLWSSVWAVMIVVLWVPTTVQLIADLLGLGTQKPIDSLVYISIVVLFYLVYRGYARHEQLEERITQVVRLAAINEADRKKKR